MPFAKQLAATNSAQAELQLIIDALSTSVAYIDPDLRYIRVNRSYAESFGVRAEQCVGRPVSEVIGATAFAQVRPGLQAALAGQLQGFEIEVETPGGPLVLSVQQIPGRAPDGSIQGVVVQAVDITERKRMEDLLRGSREQLQFALDSAGLAAWVHDPVRGIIMGDEKLRELIGLEGIEATTDQWLIAIHPEDREAVRAAFASALSGAPYDTEFRVTQGDGTRWVRSRARLLQQPGQDPVLLGICEDITGRKRVEISLLQTEKLAAVGRLASSIAHEINNPLESVGNLLYLSRASDDLETIREYLATAERELRRAGAITNQTLRFHKQATGATAVTCQEIFESALGIYQGRLINNSITVLKRKRAAHPVICFEGEVRQVVSNLIVNAIDAMPRGGRLLIRSREGTDPACGRKGLFLSVADTGPGISADTMPRIFEPFFTTKGIGGTGLGLWISQEIVKRHHGRLRLRSSTGRAHHGTVCMLFLPFDAVARDGSQDGR